MDRVRRRISGGLAAATLLAMPLARAQSSKLLVLAGDPPPDARAYIRDTVAKDGFVEGRNLRIEVMPLRGLAPELAEERAREIIARRPDVIFMLFSPETVLLQHLTRDIPIVFANCNFDPVRGGLIASEARPGANLTGTYSDYLPLILKRWALFKEVLPSLRRGAWLGSEGKLHAPSWKNREAADAYAKGFLQVEREANARVERELGIRIVEIVVPPRATEEQLIVAVRRERPEAIRIALDADPKYDGPFDKFLIAEGILNEGVVRAGADSRETWRAAVAMVGRVLRGERPADIPAFRGTKYTVKIHPGFAKRMGITLPPSVVLQADWIDT